LHVHICIYFSFHLFLGEWWWVTVTAPQLAAVVAALDACWDLPMDCLS
jgi:hypothetical protein